MPEPSMRSRRLAEAVDTMMERLLFAQHRPMARHHQTPDDRMQHDPLALWGALDLWMLEDDDRGFFTDVTPETIWPIDESVAVEKADHVALMRLRTCAPAELRGKVKIVPRRCAWLTVGRYEQDGSVNLQRIPVGWVGERWVALDVGIVTETTRTGARGDSRLYTRMATAGHMREIADSCTILVSAALTNRYEWWIHFRIDDGPVVKIATDPIGIRALFKDRERGNRQRRAALRHWVTHHWRQHRTEAEAEVFVREHLRGAEAFRWCGYDCRVAVSDYDLERAERAKRERARLFP